MRTEVQRFEVTGGGGGGKGGGGGGGEGEGEGSRNEETEQKENGTEKVLELKDRFHRFHQKPSIK